MPHSTVTLTNGHTITVNDGLEHEHIGLKLAEQGYWTTNLVEGDKETKITLMRHGVATIAPNFDPDKEIANLILGDDD